MSEETQEARSTGVETRGEPSNRVERVTRYELVPWHEPDSRETWAVRRVYAEPGYFGRVVVSWHPTRGAAEAEIRSLEEAP